MDVLGEGNLILCGSGCDGERAWVDRSNERVVRLGSRVAEGADDEAEVAVEAASEGRGYGSRIGFDFAVKFLEGLESRLSVYTREGRVLEVGRLEVDVDCRHD